MFTSVFSLFLNNIFDLFIEIQLILKGHFQLFFCNFVNKTLFFFKKKKFIKFVVILKKGRS